MFWTNTTGITFGVWHIDSALYLLAGSLTTRLPLEESSGVLEYL